MKNHFIIAFALILFISCKEEKTPSIEQSISFIVNKIDNRDINFNDRVYKNVNLSIINNNVVYDYEYYSKDDNDHYRVTENFSLDDITSTGISEFRNNYTIGVSLKSNKSNYRISKSLNEKSISDYGSPPSEWLSSAYINVKEYDAQSVKKAFKNIIVKLSEDRAEEYFTN